ncbi:MAG: hypothetical protein OXQ28_14175 [Acidobacteriota bacterium]|nr:hypothetical protein [Acidobacteriota bacterium]
MSGTNITVKVDAGLAREARVLAARRGTSLSRLVAEHLEMLVRGDQVYAAARRRALAHLRRGYDLEWERPASRHAVHDRESLR